MQTNEKKVALVTGANTGVGFQVAKALANNGYTVFVGSRDLQKGEAAVAEIGGDAKAIQINITDSTSITNAVKQIESEFGYLTLLVNNAAISPKGDARLNTLTTARDLWRHVFEVNFFSTIWLAQGLVAELAAGRGAIVNVTSIAGSRVHPFAGSAYATSKAALASLTREMAADMGPLGIRVNAIAPGEIDTAILSPGTEKLVESIPLRRLGAPEEVAKAIYYLCTEQSSYVTGAELHINGGQHV